MTPHIRAHLSKYLVAAPIALTLAFVCILHVGCKVTEENVTPEQREEMVEAKARKAAATEAETAAKAAGNVEVEKAAAAAKKEAEEDLAALEVRVLRERGGLIIGTLASIDPRLTPLAPYLGALVPLLGQRGRKHAWDALQNLNPWGNLAPGEFPHPAPIEAVKSLWKMAGAGHSTPESAAAAKNAASGAPVPLAAPTS